MQMETSTKVNGRTIRLMAMEATNMPTELLTLVTGRMINSTERVLKPGLMVPSMKASTLKERNMAKELLLLPMAVSTTETSNKTRFQEKADMYGLMERLMKVTGRRTRCMDTAS
jgi:hypothetical protein